MIKLFLFLCILIGTQGAFAEPKTSPALFQLSSECRDRILEGPGSHLSSYMDCMSTYPTALAGDITSAPFILSALAQGVTTDGKPTSEGSSERKKDEVKQYKQTMLYLVGDDAIHYAASPDHEPSVALQKFIEALMSDFPGESVEEINARIVTTHQAILAYFGEHLTND